jgi:hypothetical protein
MDFVMYTRAERAKHHVLPLPQAIYHAARDVKGGIAGFAATYGLNETTIAHKTDPARETHRLTTDEFVSLLRYTADPRLMDSLCAEFSDDMYRAHWFKTPINPSKNAAELFKYFGELSDRFGKFGQTIFEAVEDQIITHDEFESIEKIGNAMIQSVMELISRTKQMADEV